MKSSPKKFDLHKNYPLIFELGIMGALLLFIAAVKFNAPVQNTNAKAYIRPEEPPIFLSPITKQEKKPIAPILAPVPIEIPNDDPIDPPAIDFNDFDNAYAPTLSMPPEPDTKEEPEILEIVEFMPTMKGGIQALYGDITYPEMAKRANIEGRVVVQFVIDRQGNVQNPEIIRGIGAGCDEEVLRAIKLQSFTPGIQNGNFVKVRMKLTVQFRLK
jgi:protein TonB